MSAAAAGLDAFVDGPDPAPACPPPGALSGLRLAVKDMIAVRGRAFTGGLPLHAGRRAEGDAPAVRRLLDAGAVLAGMTVTDAAGFGTTTPAVANPRYPAFSAGGSSGGAAAAVAANLADLGLGTDTGGSVRIPAAACGLLAFKPTHGAVPLDGIMPLAPSFDHPGLLAADPAALARAGAVLLGDPAGGLPAPAPLAGLLVGFEPRRLAFADERVAMACRAALSRLEGAGATPLALDLGEREGLLDVHARVFAAEALAAHRPPWRPGHPGYPAVADRSLADGLALEESAARAAQGRLSAMRAALDARLSTVDVLLAPTLPGPPAPRGARTVRHRGHVLGATLYHILETMPFNVAGAPVVVVPAGPAGGPLPPASLQFAAARGRDAALLALLPALSSLAA